MKKLLSGLLVVLMLTPGLACANFMDTHAPQMAEMAGDMPCCPEPDKSPDMDTMLFKDCMKVDLQQADGSLLLKKADIAKYAFPFVQAEALHESSFTAGSRMARGPPFESVFDPESRLPVFLMTQRLRI